MLYLKCVPSICKLYRRYILISRTDGRLCWCDRTVVSRACHRPTGTITSSAAFTSWDRGDDFLRASRRDRKSSRYGNLSVGSEQVRLNAAQPNKKDNLAALDRATVELPGWIAHGWPLAAVALLMLSLAAALMLPWHEKLRVPLTIQFGSQLLSVVPPQKGITAVGVVPPAASDDVRPAHKRSGAQRSCNRDESYLRRSMSLAVLLGHLCTIMDCNRAIMNCPDSHWIFDPTPDVADYCNFIELYGGNFPCSLAPARHATLHQASKMLWGS